MEDPSPAADEGKMVELLRRFVQEHELPLRSRSYGEMAAVVLRYGAFVGSEIRRFSVLARAMEYARDYITAMEESDRSVASGTVIVADSLSHPRGRFSRPWFAPPGGLWGCLIHANTLLPPSRSLLPLAVGVACCEAIRQEGATDARLRWVNDVLIGGRKVAGFLIRSFLGPRRCDEYDLIGFGINLNNCTFPEELRDSAVALADVLGRPVDITRFQLTFLAKLTWNLGLLYYEEAGLLRQDGFSGPQGEHLLLARWKEMSDTIGRKVIFGRDVLADPLYEARVTGLQDDGALVLQLADGSSLVEVSGEIRYRTEPGEANLRP
jgi:BirA family biotin operon repressor/biotin-[acetyl-CoA-carboxylase] ligase